MSNNKQTRFSLRKGLSSDLPNHAPLGEPLFCLDTGEIYIGMGEKDPLKKVTDLDLSSHIDSMKDSLKTTNILNYSDLVVNTNNVEDWTMALNQAFSDLEDGGTLVIPQGEYRVTRATLQNKKGIVVNCSGTIMPLDNTVPLIGTLTLNNISDSVFNGLCFDGNVTKVTATNSYGTQSLLNFDRGTNCIFNNMKFKNTSESGFNSNGNLNNIIFNNVILHNIGEHGFYFGGSNVKNIKFNNLYVKDIGMTPVNQSRYCGAIKLRNKTTNDIMHDNISINGFDFVSTLNNVSGYQLLIMGYDTKNILIENGRIKGKRTCIFATNVSMDKIKINNIELEGKYMFYGYNKLNGYDQEAIIGQRRIEIDRSTLICECKNYLELTRISNSTIKLTGNWDDTMSLNDLENNVLMENVEFDMSTFRFALSKMNRTLSYRNCTFKNASATSPLIEINNDDGNIYDVTFEGVNDVADHSLFIQTKSNYNLKFINSTIRSNIKTINEVESILVSNTRLKTPRMGSYATAKQWILNNVLDLNGVRYETNGDLVNNSKVQVNDDNGYRYLSGNLVLVWGTVVISNSGYSAEATVKLPLTVTKVGYPVFGIYDSSGQVFVTARNKTATGFNLTVKALAPANGPAIGIGAVRINYHVICEI